MIVRTRVAPSPTGDPHLGTLYQALFDYILARQGRGQFILRIEDTDQKRLVPGSEERIIKALKWAGLSPDEGPIRESERLPIYQEHAEELVKNGGAYYCFCTPERLDEVRKEQEKNHQPPKYDRYCLSILSEEAEKRVKNGEGYVIRMKIPKDETITIHDELRGDVSFSSNLVDDQVLIKSDGFPTYHLAATVDDHLMNITDVVRGEEWLPSSPKHVLLYRYFGWEMPRWLHLPLLRNTDHTKLSKRKNNTSIEYYINAGYLPEALLNFLLLIVWGREKGKEKFSLAEAIAEFDVRKISMAAPVFDVAKLDWLNGEYIRAMSDEELAIRLKEFYGPKLPSQLFEPAVIKIAKDRLKKLSDFEEATTFLVKKVVGETVDPALIKSLSAGLSQIQAAQWSSSKIEEVVREVASKLNIPAKEAFMALRIAITGKSVSLPLNESMVILGRDESLRRLAHA